jgi:5'-3' exonuclease
MSTLTIDGNFFAQRIRHAACLNFIQNPEKDKISLITALTESLASEISHVNNAIDSVVFCRDWSSWRKQYEQTYPKETVVSLDKQTYKSNRDGEKDYDVAKFYEAYDHWCNLIEEKLNIPIIKHKGAEADDIVAIVSLIMEKKGKSTICWSSDGDYYQLVKPSSYLIKMPKRELYLPIAKSVDVSEKRVDSIFGKMPPKLDAAKHKFPKESVKQINPMKSLFAKCVSGDPKDNVPALFTWLSKGGSKKFKPANGHIDKAFKKMQLDYANVTEQFMYDKASMLQFIEHLLTITKQTRDIEWTYKVYLSNLKMKHLSPKQIPEDVMKGIISSWNQKCNMTQNIKQLSDSSDMLKRLGYSKASTEYFSQFDLSSVNTNN